MCIGDYPRRLPALLQRELLLEFADTAAQAIALTGRLVALRRDLLTLGGELTQFFLELLQIGPRLLLSTYLILRRLDLGSAEPRHQRRPLRLGQAQCTLRLVELARQLRKPVGIRAGGLLGRGDFLSRIVIRLSEPLAGHAQRLLGSAEFIAEPCDHCLRGRPLGDSRPLIMKDFHAAIYRARRPRYGCQPQRDSAMLPSPSRLTVKLIRRRWCPPQPVFQEAHASPAQKFGH